MASEAREGFPRYPPYRHDLDLLVRGRGDDLPRATPSACTRGRGARRPARTLHVDRVGAARRRVGVSIDRETELVTSGLVRHVRHPIYALSIALMVCSVLGVATAPMLAVGAAHVVLMNVKARN